MYSPIFCKPVFFMKENVSKLLPSPQYKPRTMLRTLHRSDTYSETEGTSDRMGVEDCWLLILRHLLKNTMGIKCNQNTLRVAYNAKLNHSPSNTRYCL